MATIITVHGTNAGDESDAGEQWWQTGSEFQERLSAYVEGDAGPVTFEPFHWSGKNSEMDRRRAGNALRKRLKAADEGGEPYAVVGHSHGGSVVNHALFSAYAKRLGFPGLKAWMTVGTPFIHLKRSALLISNLNVLGLVILIAIATSIVITLAGTPEFVGRGAELFWERQDLADMEKERVLEFEKRRAGQRADWMNDLRYTVVAVLITGLSAFTILGYTARARKRSSMRHAGRFWGQFGERWISLRHRADEAITGLKAARRADVTIIPYTSVRKWAVGFFVFLSAVCLSFVLLLERVDERYFQSLFGEDFMRTEGAYKTAGRIFDIVFSRDGSRYATVSEDRAVRVWDYPSHELVQTLPGHRYDRNSVFLSDDGERAFTYSYDINFDATDRRLRYNGEAKFWKVELAEPLANTFRNSIGGRGLHDLSPDGRHFVFGDERDLVVARADDGKSVERIPHKDVRQAVREKSGGESFGTGLARAAAFSPQEGVIAIAFFDGGLALWNWRDAELLAYAPPSPASAGAEDWRDRYPGALSLSRDGERIVAVTEGGRLSLWSLDTTDGLYQLSLNREIDLGAPLLRPEGNDPAGDADRLIRRADLREFSMDARGRRIFVALSIVEELGPRSRRILPPSYALWDIDGQRRLATLDDAALPKDFGQVTASALSARGRAIFVANGEGGVARADFFGDADRLRFQVMEPAPSGQIVPVRYIDKWATLVGKDRDYRQLGERKRADNRTGDKNIDFGGVAAWELPVIGAYWCLVTVQRTLDDALGIEDRARAFLRLAREAERSGDDSLGARMSFQAKAALFQVSDFVIYFIVAGAAWLLAVIFAFAVLKPAVWFLNKALSGQVRNLAYGNDAYGEKIAAVSEEAALVTDNFAAPRWGPIPSALGDEIEHYTENFAIDTLRRVRMLLGVNLQSAELSLSDAVSEQLSWKELIHTAYFDVDNFVKLTAVALCEAGLVRPRAALLEDPDYEAVKAWHRDMQPTASAYEARTTRSAIGRFWASLRPAAIAEGR